MRIYFLVFPALIFSLFSCSSANASNNSNLSSSSSIGISALLRVSSNRILDASGSQITFKGMTTIDIDELVVKNHWNADYFQKMHEWGAQLVRIVVCPLSWRTNAKSLALSRISNGVAWAKQYNMYSIIDWHGIGSLKDNVYEQNMDTTIDETIQFWTNVSEYFKNEPYAAFYEIFNEPVGLGNSIGGNPCSMTWAEWKIIADNIVTEIYKYNSAAIPIVGGLNWCYDLSAAGANPLTNKGIVYSSHPYPSKAGEEGEADWQAKFGYMSAAYPMIATELGFEPVQGLYYGTTNYGTHIINYLTGKGISWTVWCFSPSWAPSLINGWDYTPLAPAGLFFKSYLSGPSYIEPAKNVSPSNWTVLIQDFETCAYLGCGNGMNSSVDITIDNTDKMDGYSSLKISFTNNDWLWAGGFGSSLPLTDWSSYNGIAFWFKGCNSGKAVQIFIIDNGGEQFVVSFVDNFTEWRWEKFAFTDFSRGSWQPVGAPNDGFTKTAIEGFEISPGGTGNAVWKIDCFGLY